MNLHGLKNNKNNNNGCIFTRKFIYHFAVDMSKCWLKILKMQSFSDQSEQASKQKSETKAK